MSESFRQKKAVALRYDENKDNAPKVTATGKGHVAEKIIERAQLSNVPIQEDQNMIALLSELNINEKIPEELYQAVAEVFAYIYQVDKTFDS